VIDLHTHSTVSDGSEPPERICQMAAAAGCSAVALTDHDSLAGIPRAAEAAEAVGLRLVPGCEVSCKTPTSPSYGTVAGSVHVLVYFVEDPGSPLGRELAVLRTDRAERNLKLAARLNELGVAIDYDTLLAEAGGGESLGRPHFARALVRAGAAADFDDAFERWLAEGRPAYVPKARITISEVAVLAGTSGGVAVLAHPMSLGLEPGPLERLVAELAESGLAGLEAIYGRYRPKERKRLCEIAARTGLAVTGGSDYHGSFKPDLEVGTGLGDLAVPDEVLDALAARRPRL
jgi:predicted metal-dependent phosphoesterase TrpH